jgi:hypothetical protein
MHAERTTHTHNACLFNTCSTTIMPCHCVTATAAAALIMQHASSTAAHTSTGTTNKISALCHGCHRNPHSAASHHLQHRPSPQHHTATHGLHKHVPLIPARPARLRPTCRCSHTPQATTTATTTAGHHHRHHHCSQRRMRHLTSALARSHYLAVLLRAGRPPRCTPHHPPQVLNPERLHNELLDAHLPAPVVVAGKGSGWVSTHALVVTCICAAGWPGTGWCTGCC